MSLSFPFHKVSTKSRARILTQGAKGGDYPQNMEISNVYFIFKFQKVVEFDYLLRDMDSSS